MGWKMRPIWSNLILPEEVRLAGVIWKKGVYNSEWYFGRNREFRVSKYTNNTSDVFHKISTIDSVRSFSKKNTVRHAIIENVTLKNHIFLKIKTHALLLSP